MEWFSKQCECAFWQIVLFFSLIKYIFCAYFLILVVDSCLKQNDFFKAAEILVQHFILTGGDNLKIFSVLLCGFLAINNERAPGRAQQAPLQTSAALPVSAESVCKLKGVNWGGRKDGRLESQGAGQGHFSFARRAPSEKEKNLLKHFGFRSSVLISPPHLFNLFVFFLISKLSDR